MFKVLCKAWNVRSVQCGFCLQKIKENSVKRAEKKVCTENNGNPEKGVTTSTPLSVEGGHEKRKEELHTESDARTESRKMSGHLT